MSGNRIGVKAAALLLVPLLTAAAVPSDADQYVCSLTKVVECDSDLNCGPPAPQLPPPTFIHVDLDDSLITLLAPAERRGETTQVRAMERDGDRVIMSGIEAGRGWSMILSEADGSATITVNFGDAAMVVFGQCMPEDWASP
ncbi:MAG: hypothetical protein JSW46_02865 [Gemmatimonadota bacterium]|nr:MAG: hypothetical protein JSW46_02865 [Gemmatimonadota bacterium]